MTEKTALEGELRHMIAREGPMTVARYMALCLGHPKYGYYLTRDPFGTAGDFTTAPEINQIFGELVGLWAAAVWQNMGRPEACILAELGPGRGTLMADALRAGAIVPGFREALSVHLIETSPVLRARQQATLKAPGIVAQWHEQASDLPDGPLIILANEFFDALPVHQMVRTDTGWHERMVGLDADGNLTFALNPLPAPARSRTEGTGAIWEWRDNAILRPLCERLVRHGGAMLIIDYGYAESGFGDTLQAVRAHSFVGPLQAAGECDLTAHVDFAALARSAAHTGVRVHGPVTQGEFLHSLGIELRAEKLKAGATDAQRGAIDAAVARLTGTAASQMGELFKVIAFSPPDLHRMAGFDAVPAMSIA